MTPFPPLNLFNWPKSMTKWVNITRQELEDINKDWEQHHMDKIELVKHDPVNHPKHYTFGKYEVLPVLLDWFSDDPLLWQVGKYIARAKRKGSELQDLEKAEFYLKERIKRAKEQRV